MLLQDTGAMASAEAEFTICRNKVTSPAAYTDGGRLVSIVKSVSRFLDRSMMGNRAEGQFTMDIIISLICLITRLRSFRVVVLSLYMSFVAENAIRSGDLAQVVPLADRNTLRPEDGISRIDVEEEIADAEVL